MNDQKHRQSTNVAPEYRRFWRWILEDMLGWTPADVTQWEKENIFIEEGSDFFYHWSPGYYLLDIFAPVTMLDNMPSESYFKMKWDILYILEGTKTEYFSYSRSLEDMMAAINATLQKNGQPVLRRK